MDLESEVKATVEIKASDVHTNVNDLYIRSGQGTSLIDTDFSFRTTLKSLSLLVAYFIQVTKSMEKKGLIENRGSKVSTKQHLMKIFLLTVNDFLHTYEIAAAFTPEYCQIDPLKVLRSETVKIHFVCVCGCFFTSFANKRQHIRSRHSKLYDYHRQFVLSAARTISTKEVTLIETIIKQRDPECYFDSEAGKSLLGTQEEQIARIVGLTQVFKIVPRTYAQKGTILSLEPPQSLATAF